MKQDNSHPGERVYRQSEYELYGAACYAKGRADLLEEIGEPVAYLTDDGRVVTTKTKGCMHKSTSASFNIPLYVLPKEKP